MQSKLLSTPVLIGLIFIAMADTSFAGQYPKTIGDLFLTVAIGAVAIGSYVVGAWASSVVCRRLFNCDVDTFKGVALTGIFGAAILAAAINIGGMLL